MLRLPHISWHGANLLPNLLQCHIAKKKQSDLHLNVKIEHQKNAMRSLWWLRCFIFYHLTLIIQHDPTCKYYFSHFNALIRHLILTTINK